MTFDATEAVDSAPKQLGLSGEKVRDEERVRMRARLRPGAQSCALPGKSARRHETDDGWFEYVVYASDYDRIRNSKLEPAMAAVEQCYRAYMDEVRKHVVDSQRGHSAYQDPNPPARPLPANRADWDQVERTLAGTYRGPTPENLFYQLFKRGMRPLCELDIVEVLPPPQTEGVRQMVGAASALREASAPSHELADLRAQLAELKAMLLDRPAKKNTPQQ